MKCNLPPWLSGLIRCAEMGCAGNSMHFNRGFHTLSYQHSPSHNVYITWESLLQDSEVTKHNTALNGNVSLLQMWSVSWLVQTTEWTRWTPAGCPQCLRRVLSSHPVPTAGPVSPPDDLCSKKPQQSYHSRSPNRCSNAYSIRLWQSPLRYRKKKVRLIICNSIPTIWCKDCENRSSRYWDSFAHSK